MCRQIIRLLGSINFDPDQYAYRKNLSCQMAMFNFIQNVQENFNKDKVTIAIFIDLEGAFDALWQKGLLYKLYSDGIYGNILKLINNILTNRKATCKVNNIQEDFNCSDTGACQGSISAALFFIYYIRDMMDDIKSKKVKYSDDGTIYDSCPPELLQHLAITMSEDLSKVMKWSNKWRMPMNLMKTNAMLFCKNNNNYNFDISINFDKQNGTTETIKITQTSIQKTLGIVLDEKLTFYAHLQFIQNVATNNLIKIRELYEKNFGMPTHLALVLYTSYIRSIIESSFMCWCTIPEEHLNKLETIQGEIIKLILKIKGKVSYNALDVEAGVLPTAGTSCGTGF